MTTNDDMIARLPKERQEKIRKAIQDEIKEYQQNEAIDIQNVNKEIEKYL